MATIKLTPSPESNLIVVEKKPFDSRLVENEPAKVEEKKSESRSKVVKKASTYTGYTEAVKKANKKWNDKQAQIAIRVKPDIKAQFDEHCKSRGESLAAFIVRAGLNQIEQDIEEIPVD